MRDTLPLRLAFSTLFLLTSTVFLAGCARPSGDSAPGDTAAGDTAAPTEAEATTSWPRVPLTEALPTDRPLRAAFLLTDGVYNTELVAPFDILDHVTYKIEPGIDAFTVSADGAPVTTAEGLVIAADYSFATAPPIDILIVASAEHSRDQDLDNTEMIAWVRTVGTDARHVMSLCWGAFVLGEAGLLDGRAATTFPSDFDTFEARFNRIDVRRGPTFVHDGPVITSQGGVRSFDAAMYLVDHLYGPDVAASVGGGLLIDWPYAATALAPEVRIAP